MVDVPAGTRPPVMDVPAGTLPVVMDVPAGTCPPVMDVPAGTLPATVAALADGAWVGSSRTGHVRPAPVPAGTFQVETPRAPVCVRGFGGSAWRRVSSACSRVDVPTGARVVSAGGGGVAWVWEVT